MQQFSLLLLLSLFLAVSVAAQSGGHTLFGDIHVDESEVSGLRPIAVEVLLYSEAGGLMARQTVQSSGRYRFLDLRDGRYYVVIEVENFEVARVLVYVTAPFKTDFRQDIHLQWHETRSEVNVGVVSAAESYDRSAKNAGIFRKAAAEIDKRHYQPAIVLLHELVESDPGDFPAWTELGTTYFILKELDEAEKSYLQALKVQPDYIGALVSFGRLRIVQKKYDSAVELLAHALKVEPHSAQANYFLGEAYLQLKLGSKAVGYLYEAIRLDPIGMADAHLRLAALYNAKDMKDKAAAEYEAFLKKIPNYPYRKSLKEYIAANKK
jgi:tetratricopeptide (TPR) repeat protein